MRKVYRLVKLARLGDDKEVTNKSDTKSDIDKEATSGTITS